MWHSTNFSADVEYKFLISYFFLSIMIMKILINPTIWKCMDRSIFVSAGQISVRQEFNMIKLIYVPYTININN